MTTIKRPYYKASLALSLVVLVTFGDPAFDLWEPLLADVFSLIGTES